MAEVKTVFKRYELKFLLTEAQYRSLKEVMKNYMRPDEHGVSNIYNIYYDTPSYLLIRRSIEKPDYKEKLRIRSYGAADNNKKVFLELKKKADGITYKRRIAITLDEFDRYMNGKAKMPDTQIGREIDYFVNQYKPLKPAVFLSYDREAFYGKDDEGFRMTFDRNILWRDTDMTLCGKPYGDEILTNDKPVLLEVKLSDAYPLWLVKFINDNKLARTAFSKYGKAFKRMTGQEARHDGTVSGSIKELLKN